MKVKENKILLRNKLDTQQDYIEFREKCIKDYDSFLKSRGKESRIIPFDAAEDRKRM